MVHIYGEHTRTLVHTTRTRRKALMIMEILNNSALTTHTQTPNKPNLLKLNTHKQECRETEEDNICCLSNEVKQQVHERRQA